MSRCGCRRRSPRTGTGCSRPTWRASFSSSDPPGPGRNGKRDFHSEKRGNATHASTADPEAQLYRKGQGKEAKLSLLGHVLMENRSGLIVAVTKATGIAGRKAAEEMIVRHSPKVLRIILGGKRSPKKVPAPIERRATLDANG
jgi:hypothetical protein